MALEREKTSNLSNDQRINILKCGYYLEELYDCTVKYAWIDRELRAKGIVHNRATIKKWLDSRQAFEQTGVLHLIVDTPQLIIDFDFDSEFDFQTNYHEIAVV